jgi:hypothetical protein
MAVYGWGGKDWATKSVMGGRKADFHRLSLTLAYTASPLATQATTKPDKSFLSPA